MTTHYVTLKSEPKDVQFGRDSQGFFVDTHWEEYYTVQVVILKGTPPQPIRRHRRVEERTYCSQAELIEFAKGVLAAGKVVVGEIPPLAKIAEVIWGAVIQDKYIPRA